MRAQDERKEKKMNKRKVKRYAHPFCYYMKTKCIRKNRNLCDGGIYTRRELLEAVQDLRWWVIIPSILFSILHCIENLDRQRRIDEMSFSFFALSCEMDPPLCSPQKTPPVWYDFLSFFSASDNSGGDESALRWSFVIYIYSFLSSLSSCSTLTNSFSLHSSSSSSVFLLLSFYRHTSGQKEYVSQWVASCLVLFQM